jgi:hypothetical protein
MCVYACPCSYCNKKFLPAKLLPCLLTLLPDYPPPQITHSYCNKKFLPSKLSVHLRFFCGPDAKKSDALAKQQKKRKTGEQQEQEQQQQQEEEEVEQEEQEEEEQGELGIKIGIMIWDGPPSWRLAAC